MKNRPKLTPLGWALFTAMVCQPLLAQERSPRDPSSQTDALTANIIVFDSPGGSSCGFASCIGVTGIDAQGTVVGDYVDANQLDHGFYRLADGTFGPIEVASPYCDAYMGCTSPIAINQSGTVVGVYQSGPADPFYAPFSDFLRDPSGSYLDFNFPGSERTDATAINPAGVVGGDYYDSTFPNAQHLFIRDADGNYTSFDLPGSVCYCGPNQRLDSINSRDDATVVFGDGDGYGHAFLRESSGKLTAIHPFEAYDVEPYVIDDGGRIIGNYSAKSCRTICGFLRDQAGNYTDLGEYYPQAIDAKGTIIGFHCDDESHSLCYGFYRLKDGSVGLFNPPGAEETFPMGINVHGDIAGFFYDKNHQGHGFLRLNR